LQELQGNHIIYWWLSGRANSMSYIEASFISRRIYNASENERLQEHDLEVDELYVAMFALANNTQGSEAAKLPVEFKDIARTDSGMYLASLALLDKRLKPTVECVGDFYDGYWVDVRERIVINEIQPLHCYVRTYNPNVDADLQIASEKLSLVA